jgi:hypothetical protein
MLAEEGSTMKIAVGNEVRVHYHPPGPRQSFVEGVVSRVEVSTLRGRVFVVDATYEVILDREQPIKDGYQNYVLYERWEEFPGRIEVLSEAQQEPGRTPEHGQEPEGEQQPEHELEPTSPSGSEMAATLEPELELALRAPEPDSEPQLEAEPEPFQIEVEHPNIPERSNLITALFRKRR